MVGDAIDAAIEENRARRQRANSRSNEVDYTINNRGVDEMNSENWEYALQLFNQFLAYYPNNPRGLYHRAKLDNNEDLKKFVKSLEKTCIQTVESGSMTKDLAILVGPSTKYLTTNEFLDVIDGNLKKRLNQSL